MTDSIHMDTKIPAVVLAGGEADSEMQARFAIRYRAELPVAGKPMLQWVIDALAGSERVGKTRVVGAIPCEGVAGMIPPADTLMENVIAGVEACAGDAKDGRVLIVTSDIPLLTSAAVDDFIGRCDAISADLYYPVILKEENERRFPSVKRTYAKLAEGTVTGGNIVIMKAKFVEVNAGLLREIMAARKSVPRMARLIGIPTLARMIIAQTVWAGALSLPLLERTIGRMMNARLKAVRSPYPEIGADIDRIDQLDAMERLLILEGELK